jgi:hypothetical protein
MLRHHRLLDEGGGEGVDAVGEGGLVEGAASAWVVEVAHSLHLVVVALPLVDLFQ